MDLHHFGKLDLDPDQHQSEKKDPDPHQSQKQDPDQDQSQCSGAVEAQNGGMEAAVAQCEA